VVVILRYDSLQRDVSGAKPGMKKWSLGYGHIFVISFRKSVFNCPGYLKAEGRERERERERERGY
jgi:hypothetical protein